MDSEKSGVVPWYVPEDIIAIQLLFDYKNLLQPGAKRYGKRLAKKYQIDLENYQRVITKSLKEEYAALLSNLKTDNIKFKIAFGISTSNSHPMRSIFCALTPDSECINDLVVKLKNQELRQSIVVALETDRDNLRKFYENYSSETDNILHHTPIELVHTRALSEEYDEYIATLRQYSSS